MALILAAVLLLCSCGGSDPPLSNASSSPTGGNNSEKGSETGAYDESGTGISDTTDIGGITDYIVDPTASGGSAGSSASAGHNGSPSKGGSASQSAGASTSGRLSGGSDGSGVSSAPIRSSTSGGGGDSTSSQSAGSATTRRPNRTTKTPSREDAQSLLPATGSTAASLNAVRIRYCLVNYGFCYLAPGELFELSETLELGMNNATLGSADTKRPAELRLIGRAWRLIRVTGRNITLKNLTLNYNSQYGTGTSVDKAVVQLYGPSTVVDGCKILGGNAPERKGNNQITGVYFLYDGGSGACTVKNSTIRNCFYGVLFRDTLTRDMGHTLEGCTVTYNRCDGITFIGYGTAKNCTITYNGYDCLNPVGGTSYPIPGAGVYTQNNAKGFTLDGCEIAYNNGFNLDINRAANCTITNNRIHDPGWTSFPEAADYKTVSYRNGISACLTGLRNSAVTGNTITNNVAANRLDGSYAHIYTGGDVNGYFRVSRSAAAFSDLPAGGASVVACALVNYPGAYENYGNTISGNTFVAKTADGATTGVGLVVGRNVGYSAANTWFQNFGNRLTDNVVSGSETGTVRCGRNTWSGNSDDSTHTGDAQHNRGSAYYFYK